MDLKSRFELIKLLIFSLDCDLSPPAYFQEFIQVFEEMADLAYDLRHEFPEDAESIMICVQTCLTALWVTCMKNYPYLDFELSSTLLLRKYNLQPDSLFNGLRSPEPRPKHINYFLDLCKKLDQIKRSTEATL